MVGIGGAGRPLRPLRLRGPADRPERPRPLRQAARRRPHRAGLGPGGHQPLRRARAGAADRRAAAVRLLRQLEHAGDARRGRAAAQHLAGGSVGTAPKPSSAGGRLRGRSRGSAPHARRSRVVIAAGGTAGHVVPALAVADALRAEGADGLVSRRLATAPRPSWCPTAGYEIDLLASAASTAATRSAPPALCGLAAAAVPGRPQAAARAPRRCRARRRRLRRRRRPASRRSRCGLPLVLTEADRHLGPRQPAAGPPRAPGLPRVPDRGARGRRATWSPGARFRRRCSTADRDAARERFGIAAGRALPARLRRQPGRALDQPRALEAFAGAGGGGRDFHVLHISGSRDYPRRPRALASAPQPRRATRCSSTSPTSPTTLAASDLVLARSGGSIFEIAAAGRPGDPGSVSVRRRGATSTPTPPGWPTPGRRWSIEDAELDPARLAAVARELLGDEARLERDGGRLARPGATRRGRSGSPPRSSAAIGNDLRAMRPTLASQGGRFTSSRSAARG